MAGLQRSAVSFRRQGSSGLVWDDKFLGELNRMAQREEENRAREEQLDQPEDEVKEPKPSVAVGSTTNNNTIERSRSNGGGRGYRTGKVSPAIEPPSPTVSACGFCGAFGKKEKNTRHRRKPGLTADRKW